MRQSSSKSSVRAVRATATPVIAKPAPSSIDDIRAMLTRAGLRRTAPRVAVLRRLIQSTLPVSHSDLVDALVPDGFDATTIFRNLKDLNEAGIVDRHDLGDHTWRYELARADGKDHRKAHPHFLCEDCGTVACLDSSRINIRAGANAPSAVADGGVEIQLKGRCDHCR